MSTRREYEMLFRLNAQMGASYSNTFKSAQGSIVSMQKEIEALNKVQSDISSYQKQQTAVEATQKRLDALGQQYDNIQREMQETGESSSLLQNKLIAKQLQIDKTTSSLDQQTVKLNQMGAALRDAGVNTDDLTKETSKLGNQIEDIKNKQVEAAEKAQDFGSAASQAFMAVNQAIITAGVAVALKKIAEYLWSCAEAAIDFESAMTGVAKTTNLTDAEFTAMAAELKAMSKDIPATTTELAAIAETAGQLGIEKSGLLDFTEIMAMLGTATNMTSDEAATMLAQFASITGMDPSNYVNLGSTIVDLGNNFATTERNIAEMSQTVAAAGAIAGMSEADITAIAAAVTSLGISSQNGGTQMTKLISDINSAVASGEGLELWANAARMSADDFADAWGSNAAGALDLFIRGLNETYQAGGDVYSILTDLGITETRMVTMITSLTKSGSRLTDTLDIANGAWLENNALITEAEKRYDTTQSKMILMQNAYNTLKVAVGDNYTPALQGMYDVGIDVMGVMTEFIEENPALVQALTAALGVVGTVTLALAAYTVVAKAAAFATAAITTAIPPVKAIMAVTLAVAALSAAVTAMSASVSEEEQELRILTSTSREQYRQMRELEDQYNEVCSGMGETSYEAQMLKRQIDKATTAFEENKQSADELAATHRELMDSHSQLSDSYSDTVDGIDREYSSSSSLIGKLDELLRIEDKTVGTKQQILTLVEMLNESMPELGLSYNAYTDSLNTSVAAMLDLLKVEAEQDKFRASQENYKGLLNEQDALYQHLQDSINNATGAEKELQTVQGASSGMLKGKFAAMVDDNGRVYSTVSDYISAVKSAESANDEATIQMQEAQAAYDDNLAAQEAVIAQIGTYVEETTDASGATAALKAEIYDVTSEVKILTEAYEDAYKAAYESISGQYQLWDKAAEVVATDAGAMNSALESQIKYWQDYNDNIAGLTDRTADVEGLNEMIASFADGSTDSINAIAGMAGASDEKLAEMVSNWQELQDEQKMVSESLAELKTNFTDEMAALQTELEGTIADMNLNEEAAQSGKDTIQGFINGAANMLPAVEKAYAKLSQAAFSALSGGTMEFSIEGNSPDGSHADGLDYVPFDGYLAELHQGEQVLTANEAKTYQSFGAFTAQKTIEAIPRDPNVSSSAVGGDGSIPEIKIAPVYQITGMENTDELQKVLSSQNDALKEVVLEIIRNDNYDALRRAYV